MSASGFTLRAALLWTLVPLGCGARTTLDEEDYLVTVGGTAAGGSAAGGQGAASAAGGSAGVVTGGSAPGGMTGVGGTAVAGAGGTIGVGGKGGAGGKGGVTREIAAACQAFCEPYFAACPQNAGTLSGCSQTCIAEFMNQPEGCRELLLEAVYCMADNMDPGAGCDVLTTGANACLDLLQRAEECGATQPPPPPPPPACGVSEYVGEFDCETTLSCVEGSYIAYCYLANPTLTCDCFDDFGGHTTFTSDVPLQAACGYALDLCYQLR